MARTQRLSTTGVLIVCLVGTQWSGPLFASEQEPPSRDVPSAQSAPEHTGLTLNGEALSAIGSGGPASTHALPGALAFTPVESNSFAQRRWGRGRGDAARAEIIFGAVASIAGAAVLVYANRPDCNTNQMASGCGYGTKVIGGAVLSAGLVTLVIGALTWR
jgi:hypothetical protein